MALRQPSWLPAGGHLAHHPLIFFFPIFLRFPPDLRSVGLARRRLSTSLSALPAAARDFVEEAVRLCRPREVLLCDGSEEEGKELLRGLQDDGVLHPLPKYDNW